jgi:hypothetical protein
VHQRAALDAGEHDRLQFLGQFLGGVAGDDDAAARAALRRRFGVPPGLETL